MRPQGHARRMYMDSLFENHGTDDERAFEIRTRAQEAQDRARDRLPGRQQETRQHRQRQGRTR
jgi:hypothetical protein